MNIEEPSSVIEYIKFLIDNEYQEDEKTEYKSDLPTKEQSSVKKFLYTVTSFANSGGGNVIYGISEKIENGKNTGLPDLTGLGDINFDEQIKRLEQLIRDCIQPRIGNVRIKPVEVDRAKLIIVNIPQSFSAPHLVSYQQSGKFYGRNSSGKFQLDVEQIRDKFLFGNLNTEKIKDYRSQRVERIFFNQDTPVKLVGDTYVIIHLIPHNAFLRSDEVNWLSAHDQHLFKPFYGYDYGYRINAEGLLVSSSNTDGVLTYSQLHRNGIIEANCSCIINPYEWNGHTRYTIPHETLEEEIIQTAKDNLGMLRAINVSTPIYLMVSLLGAQEFAIAPEKLHSKTFLQPIGKEILQAPDVTINSYSENIEQVTKPIFDYIWQSSGLTGSANYDKDGNRIKQS